MFIYKERIVPSNMINKQTVVLNMIDQVTIALNVKYTLDQVRLTFDLSMTLLYCPIHT